MLNVMMISVLSLIIFNLSTDRHTDISDRHYIHYIVSLLCVTNSERTCRAASSQLKSLEIIVIIVSAPVQKLTILRMNLFLLFE